MFQTTTQQILEFQSTLQIDDEEEISQFMATNSKEEIRRLIQEIKQGASTTQGIPSTDGLLHRRRSRMFSGNRTMWTVKAF